MRAAAPHSPDTNNSRPAGMLHTLGEPGWGQDGQAAPCFSCSRLPLLPLQVNLEAKNAGLKR